MVKNAVFRTSPASLLVFFLSATRLFAADCDSISGKIGLVLSHNNTQTTACQVQDIIPLSKAWYSELRAGDHITAINSIKLNRSQPCQDLQRHLQQNNDRKQAISLTLKDWQNTSRSINNLITLPADSSFKMAHQRFIDVSFFTTAGFSPVTDGTSEAAELMRLQYDLQKNRLKKSSTELLFQTLACLPSASPTQVLPIIAHIQNEPLKLAFSLTAVRQILTAAETDFSLPGYLTQIQSLSYSISAAANSPEPFLHCQSETTADELLDQLEQFLSTSHQLSKQALADISAVEYDFFINHYQQVSNTIAQSQNLLNEPDRNSLEIISRLFEIAAKVDYGKLSDAAAFWFQLAQKKNLQQLTLCMAGLELSRPLERKTPFGSIVLGTHKDDSYHFNLKHNTITLLIDPSGNDHYLRSDTAISDNISPIYNTAILDLSGNDQYNAVNSKGFAFASLGNALLADLAGNDRYKARSWAQASAFAGIAALYDVSGNDQYSADSFSQSAALFGSALLVDSKGNDMYKLHHHGQALGLPYGHGVLLDQNGNDHYQMHNGLNSSYPNTESSSESWGQGCGKGFRHILPGGIGILLDSGGNNSFTAHEFAQGGGYYYGMGLLYSPGDGHDQYRGTHYNAGFSAHQAIGGFIESAGNDTYRTRGPAFCGTAWDQSISLFHDQSGNDTYSTRDFSLAAAAHNAIASFWDISGHDIFTSAIQPACISSNQYHGGHSLSYFFSANKNIPARINSEQQEFVLIEPLPFPGPQTIKPTSTSCQ